jgi:hypothetical protein
MAVICFNSTASVRRMAQRCAVWLNALLAALHVFMCVFFGDRAFSIDDDSQARP